MYFSQSDLMKQRGIEIKPSLLINHSKMEVRATFRNLPRDPEVSRGLGITLRLDLLNHLRVSPYRNEVD